LDILQLSELIAYLFSLIKPDEEPILHMQH